MPPFFYSFAQIKVFFMNPTSENKNQNESLNIFLIFRSLLVFFDIFIDYIIPFCDVFGYYNVFYLHYIHQSNSFFH